jgi:hypothetical protein
MRSENASHQADQHHSCIIYSSLFFYSTTLTISAKCQGVEVVTPHRFFLVLIMMRDFTRQCLTNILVVSPFCCTSFSTRSHHLSAFVPNRERKHHAHAHVHPSDFSFSHPRRALTVLSLGRERRMSSSYESISVEEKLISVEEAARQKRLGQMKQRLQKSVNREDRISALEFQLKEAEEKSQSESESLKYMSAAERAELKGLLKVRSTFEEQYDPLTFTEEHLEFKAMHNDAFIQLSRYCERERVRSKVNSQETGDLDNDDTSQKSTNLFFLDGPDGGTASALIQRGNFKASQCYVANRHESSCDSLRASGGGLLPNENVIHSTASEALTISQPLSIDGVEATTGGENDIDVALYAGEDGALAHVDFSAYYFDGCGGYVPHIVGMLSAALMRDNCDASKPIAVGYSLLGGNKNVVGKELTVSQALTIIARRRGMRLVHALDDPLRYGISPDIRKIGGSNGGTFTTWLLLEPDHT